MESEWMTAVVGTIPWMTIDAGHGDGVKCS